MSLCTQTVCPLWNPAGPAQCEAGQTPCCPCVPQSNMTGSTRGPRGPSHALPAPDSMGRLQGPIPGPQVHFTALYFTHDVIPSPVTCHLLLWGLGQGRPATGSQGVRLTDKRCWGRFPLAAYYSYTCSLILNACLGQFLQVLWDLLSHFWSL